MLGWRGWEVEVLPIREAALPFAVKKQKNKHNNNKNEIMIIIKS